MSWEKLFEKKSGHGLKGGSVQITSDGGFILAVFNSIIKLDSHGNRLWQKFFNFNEIIEFSTKAFLFLKQTLSPLRSASIK